MSTEEQRQRWRENTRRHREKHRERVLAGTRESVQRYRENHPEKWRGIKANTYQRRRGHYRSQSMANRFPNHVPPWAEAEEIEAFYSQCPDGMEVDHVLPLNGQIVSGLHVRANLQYLTPLENKQKRNHVVP